MFDIEAPSDVWQVLAPCEMVCKCLGLIPVFSGQGLHTWKRWVNFVHLISTVVLISRSIFHCLPMDLHNQESAVVIKQSGAIIMVMFYIQPVFGITCTRLVVGNIYELLTTLGAVDSKFTLLGIQKSYTKERNIVFGLTASTFSGCLILIAVCLANPMTVDVEYTIETIFFQLHYSMTCVYATSISFLTLKRFCMLNEAISKHFISSRPLDADLSLATEQEKPTNNRQLFWLNHIIILLEKLIGTVDLVNRCFAIQILFCVGMCFIIGVFCCFYLSRTFYHRTFAVLVSILNLIWYIYYLFFILVFIAIGSRIVSESKRIGVLIHKAINCNRTSNVVNSELLIFSQQLLHHSPVITCGLFVYDWSLFYTIIGATATYLIILIQFDVSFPNLEDATGNGSMVG